MGLNVRQAWLHTGVLQGYMHAAAAAAGHMYLLYCAFPPHLQ